MKLKIGELAKRAGLTVRTLHHYDEIGLLSPSIRSDAGYRLYGPDDVTRLYRVLALRQLGLPLADIADLLTSQNPQPAELIERQLQALSQQMAEAEALRQKLLWLQSQLRSGRSPEAGDWLSTVEMMTMYEKYFSSEDLAALRERQNDPLVQAAEQSWPALIAEAKGMIAEQVPPESAAAQDLAKRWFALLQQFSGNAPQLLPKLNKMYQSETSLQQQTGIDPELMAYIGRAVAVKRLAIYSRYLNEEEMVRMRANYGCNSADFPAVIGRMRELFQQGVPADSDEARAAAQAWDALTTQFAGNDPATRQKLRLALAQEPDLLEGTGIDSALLDYVRAALATVA